MTAGEDYRTLPEPSPAEYGAALGLLAGLVIGAGAIAGHLALVGAAAVALMLFSVVPGLLWQGRGYSFTEGWVAGLVAWPLAVAFGIWAKLRTSLAHRDYVT